MTRGNGGIIGPINDPTEEVASGVWPLEEQYQARLAGNWPNNAFIGQNGLRFDDASSDTLSRTPSSAGNRRIFTYSTWLKGHNADKKGSGYFFGAVNGSNTDAIGITTTGLQVSVNSATSGDLNTAQLFRDYSAWYHIVWAVDTTQATASNRMKIYVNGTQVTSFDTETYPSQNYDFGINNTGEHRIGNLTGGSSFWDGYMADIYFIDGKQLAPTNFGVTDSNGVWTPAATYTGDYGTNGFHLVFEDASSLGKDFGPGGNNFTVNNLTSIDQTTDTPLNNFATYNPLLSQVASVDGRGGSWNGQLTEGNLASGTAVDTYNNQFSTFGLTSGKWYAEFKMSTTDNNFSHGIVNDVFFSNLGSYIGQSTASGVRNIGYYSQNGNVLKNNSAQYTGSTYGVSGTDVISIALDLDNNYVYFAKNGTYQNSGDPTSGSSGTGGVAIDADTTWFLGSTTHSLSSSGLKISYANFGNPPFTISSGNADGNGYGNFEYAVPSGYYAICTKNLAEYG